MECSIMADDNVRSRKEGDQSQSEDYFESVADRWCKDAKKNLGVFRDQLSQLIEDASPKAIEAMHDAYKSGDMDALGKALDNALYNAAYNYVEEYGE